MTPETLNFFAHSFNIPLVKLCGSTGKPKQNPSPSFSVFSLFSSMNRSMHSVMKPKNWKFFITFNSNCNVAQDGAGKTRMQKMLTSSAVDWVFSIGSEYDLMSLSEWKSCSKDINITLKLSPANSSTRKRPFSEMNENFRMSIIQRRE